MTTRHRYAALAVTLLATFLLVPRSSTAEVPVILTAAELYAMCQSKYDTDSGLCAGYITAIAEQLATEGIDGRHSCNFGQARSQQFVDLFVAYAAASPDALHAPARSIVASALTRAFECRD